MATATTVTGRRGLGTARVLFDHGSQVSFVPANLAKRVGAERNCLIYPRIDLAGFCSQPSLYNICEYELEQIGVHGR